MGKKEPSEQFINSVILLIKTQNLIKDIFFYDRFTDRIFDFSLDFLEFLAEKNTNDVVQSQVLAERCFADISKLTDILKELQYLGLVKNTPLLLKTEFNLLAVKLGILKQMKERGSTLDPEKDRTLENLKIGSNRSSTLDIQKRQTSAGLKGEPKLYHKTENQELTPSKKKILDYIRSYPNTRTKDIIYEFNALSGRSVKRNLTDLLRAGFVKKRVDNKAVYYYAS